jgi:hypothetical protein
VAALGYKEVTHMASDKSRLYPLAPNLYATSRRAWEDWHSLPHSERARYVQAARTTTSQHGGATPRRERGASGAG